MSGGYWDIHNHILPGIDDGSSCMEETCSLLREEYKQGVRHIIFTPHHRPKMFRVSVDDREKVWMETLSELQGKFPDMQFFLGCEFFVHENMAEELRDARCRMAGTDVVLAEFSSASHFAGMILSFLFLSQATKTLPLGTAYAVWTGIGALGAVIVGIVLFKEPVTAARIFFVSLLLIGIVGLKATSGH